jgi:hypothetical protein
VARRGRATLCTRHAYTKYIIDNRMFTIQFENGLLFSILDLLKCMIAIQKVYKYSMFVTALKHLISLPYISPFHILLRSIIE